MSVTELGVPYLAADWPTGLMCTRCPHAFREGERYTIDLYAFSGDVPMVRVLCLACATTWRSGSELPERPA